MRPSRYAPIATQDAGAVVAGKVAAIKFLTQHGRAILADDMGLGKTRQANHDGGCGGKVGSAPTAVHGLGCIAWVNIFDRTLRQAHAYVRGIPWANIGSNRPGDSGLEEKHQSTKICRADITSGLCCSRLLCGVASGG